MWGGMDREEKGRTGVARVGSSRGMTRKGRPAGTLNQVAPYLEDFLESRHHPPLQTPPLLPWDGQACTAGWGEDEASLCAFSLGSVLVGTLGSCP